MQTNAKIGDGHFL